MNTKGKISRLMSLLSREALADALGVTLSDIADWESGRSVPNEKAMQLLAEKYDIMLNKASASPMLSDGSDARLNADRFSGFADIYESFRPTVPSKACDIIVNYLERTPETVIDLGCGTGLSTLIWKDRCLRAIGIEPSQDMILTAMKKSTQDISFKQAYADNTGLPGGYADIVVCSQSFHWMNPASTLTEINRILKPGGIFATIDCDWPPVSCWQAELEYSKLFDKVRMLEQNDPSVKITFHRWEKEHHLENIRASGYFRYFREILFDSRECCTAERFVGIALSQGSLQTILKIHPEKLESDVSAFRRAIYDIFADRTFDILFCYRMRIGKK